MSDFFIDPDIARARTISTDYYISPRYFEQSKEKIFAQSWQFIGNTDMVKEPGSVQPFTLLEHYMDEPLLLSRDAEGKLHCLSNVCTHRGNILIHEACKLKQLTCKYHGRRFALNGKFVSMPEFKEVEDFPCEDDNLYQLPIFQWGKLLFTSLNPGLPAGAIFGEIQKRLDWFPMDQLVYKAELSKDYLVKANWALYCENYLEGFHIPFVHSGLNAVLDFSKYTTELFRYSNLQTGI